MTDTITTRIGADDDEVRKRDAIARRGNKTKDETIDNENETGQREAKTRRRDETRTI